MNTNSSSFSCEDVLNAFAVEPTHDRATLERYLREYPQYAIELAHLSRELARKIEKPGPLSIEDRAAIDEAWKVYVSSTSAATATLLTSLSVPKLRELALRLEVPRQIIAAFRERKVIVSSIPRKFLKHLAAGLDTTVEQVIAALTLPQMTYARSHKSDEKPTSSGPATFEQLLIEAQVPEGKRAELMAEEN